MTPTLRTDLDAPRPEKRPETLTQIGRTRTDDYRWMKDENWQTVMRDPSQLNADIRAMLDAENAYTRAVTADLSPLSDAIFEEMKGRMEPAESQVPVPDGPYAYYHRYREGDQHGLFGRKARDPQTGEVTGEETILLDADILAKGKRFFDMGSVAHSPDHTRIAYTIDDKGSENYEIFVHDISGETRSTGITTSTGSVEWAADSDTLLWTERDENQRPCAVFAKRISDPDSAPKELFRQTDPGLFVGVDKSDSDAFILISSHNHVSTELRLIPADTPFSDPTVFAPLADGMEYSVHEQGGYFYILTNRDGATDFKIMRRRVDAPGADWEPFIDHTPGTLILGLSAYKHYLARLVRENALPRIIIRDMRDGSEHDIRFDEAAYGLGLSGGFEYDTDIMRFTYSSPTTPAQIFDYNMASRERVLRKTQSVPSGHEPSDYVTDRLMIPARDGEEVPVTLLRHKDTPTDGSAPVLLYGYGSYGITIPAGFRTGILSLVDRGFIYAIAHIRGSMAKGYQWYLDGKLEKKINTFNDFVDVGRALVERGLTQRGKIVAHGGSAGGLLVGAALNADPSLFGGVIAAVPFVDVLNTMSDDTLPLTPPEWPEWGNPLADADAYDRIEAYSPYDNVVKADYPPLFITGGLTDPRVTYWEPAKWAARLRDHQTGDAPILLKINMDAGHQGESGRYDGLKEPAMEYAFAVAVAGTSQT